MTTTRYTIELDETEKSTLIRALELRIELCNDHITEEAATAVVLWWAKQKRIAWALLRKLDDAPF